MSIPDTWAVTVRTRNAPFYKGATLAEAESHNEQLAASGQTEDCLLQMGEIVEIPRHPENGINYGTTAPSTPEESAFQPPSGLNRIYPVVGCYIAGDATQLYWCSTNNLDMSLPSTEMVSEREPGGNLPSPIPDGDSSPSKSGLGRWGILALLALGAIMLAKGKNK